jgi:hypothetical protein
MNEHDALERIVDEADLVEFKGTSFLMVPRFPSKPPEGTSQKHSAIAKPVYRRYSIYRMFAICNYPLLMLTNIFGGLEYEF